MSIRVFVALQLSITATRQLTEAAEPQRKAACAGGEKVVWVPAKNQHITLKFIGNIADELLEGVVLAVRKAAALAAPLRVAIKGFGAFPEAGSENEAPRIFWAGAAAIGGKGDALGELHAAVETQLEAIGFPREARPFHPHVTLGRVQKKTDELQAELSSAGAVKNAAAVWIKPDIAITESLVDAVIVFESRMVSGGVAYIERARLPLDLLNAERRNDLKTVQRARGEEAANAERDLKQIT